MRDMERIITYLAAHYGIPFAVLTGRSQGRAEVRVRHLCWYAIRRHTAHSFPAIAMRFGRDHSSVIHGARKGERITLEDREALEAVERSVGGERVYYEVDAA